MDQKIFNGMVVVALLISIVALVMNLLPSSSSNEVQTEGGDSINADVVKKLDERVSGIETKILGLGTMAEKISGIESRIAGVEKIGIEKKISDMEGRISGDIGIEKKISDMEGRFAKEDTAIRRDINWVQDLANTNHTQIMTYLDKTIDSFNSTKEREDIKKMLGYVDWKIKS